MPRRWKKQTAMFMFVMAAMTSTIFAMKNRKGLGYEIASSSSSSDSENEVAQKKQKNTPSTKSSENSENGFNMKPFHDGKFEFGPVVYDHYNAKVARSTHSEKYQNCLTKDVSEDRRTKVFEDLDKKLKNKVAQSSHYEKHSQNDDDDLDLNEDELFDENVFVERAQSTGMNESIERDNRRLENVGKTEDARSIHSETNDQANDDDIRFYSDPETDNEIEGVGKATVFQGYDRGYATNALVEGKPPVNRADWEKDALDGNPFRLNRKNPQHSQNKGQEEMKGKNKDNFQGISKKKTKHEFQNNKMNRPSNWERSRRSGRLPVENTLVKVKKVKNENLFATFLKDADLVKYTLLNAKHESFIERIPVTRSDYNGYLIWNMHAETTVSLHLNLNFADYQTEVLKFVNDVFSRIPDVETPSNYKFYFDTTEDFKNWFMLAIHKRKNVFIGRKWTWDKKQDFQTCNFEPCDVRYGKKWISKKASDGICKSLLVDGFHFPLGRSKIQKISENDIQCALSEKFDKSVKFLLSKHSNMTETAYSFCLDNLCSKESLKSKNLVPNEEFDEEDDHYVISEDDIKKAFCNNLCESFKFMMKSKNWPERLWKYALESDHLPSKNMLKLLLERIKSFPEENHLEILMKTNVNGKTAFFNKLMNLAEKESTSGHLDSLKIFHPRQVRAHLYQRLLFSGTVKPDLDVVKFALKKNASFQEKTEKGAAFQIANNFCWCKSERAQEDMRNNANNKICLHVKLVGKTALEIATMLERHGLENGSNKKKFKLIKTHLEREENKKKNNLDLAMCISSDSEHAESDVQTESEHDDDDSKKRKRKGKQ